MKLDKEQVAHLAKLARLDLGDTSGVEPFAMPSKARGWRQDRAMEVDDYTRELILSNFPERSGDLLAAPGVFETPKK